MSREEFEKGYNDQLRQFNTPEPPIKTWEVASLLALMAAAAATALISKEKPDVTPPHARSNHAPVVSGTPVDTGDAGVRYYQAP